MTTQTRTEIDMEKLEALAGSIIGDLGAVASSALAVIGDKLGLYRALNEIGPATPDQLAAATGTSERYLRHWLLNQAASGYLDYDAASGRYLLTSEQAMVFTTDDTPASLLGAFTLVTSATSRRTGSLRSMEHRTSSRRVGWLPTSAAASAFRL